MLDLTSKRDVEVLAGELSPVRACCVAKDQLLVLDGRPVTGGMRSHLWILDLESGELRADDDLALHPAVVQHSLLVELMVPLIFLPSIDGSTAPARIAWSKRPSPSRCIRQLRASGLPAAAAGSHRSRSSSSPERRHRCLGTVETVSFVDGVWKDVSAQVNYGETVVFSDDGRHALVSYSRRTFRSLTTT